MLKLRIIPTILFNNFKLVKGIGFDSWRTVGSIMQAVKIYNLREVDELIILDISATNNNKKVDLDLINEIANETFMPLTVGGGIKSVEDVSSLLEAGADKVSINSSTFNSASVILILLTDITPNDGRRMSPVGVTIKLKVWFSIYTIFNAKTSPGPKI